MRNGIIKALATGAVIVGTVVGLSACGTGGNAGSTSSYPGDTAGTHQDVGEVNAAQQLAEAKAVVAFAQNLAAKAKLLHVDVSGDETDDASFTAYAVDEQDPNYYQDPTGKAMGPYDHNYDLKEDVAGEVWRTGTSGYAAQVTDGNQTVIRGTGGGYNWLLTVEPVQHFYTDASGNEIPTSYMVTPQAIAALTGGKVS